MQALIPGLFWGNVTCHILLLIGLVWCIAAPAKRIYPMNTKGALYYLMWVMFWFVFASNFALVILDWNTGLWTSPLRLVLGFPLAILGAGLLLWGVGMLGVRNTSALPNGFVPNGPYAFTRNPQYVGDIALFVGMSIIANSEMAFITHMLTSLVFLIGPWAEEPWLEEQYGDTYKAYKTRVPRFL